MLLILVAKSIKSCLVKLQLRVAVSNVAHRGPAHGIYFGYFPDISVWPAAMFEGSNVQWRLGKIAFHIAD